ncbi:MULTISPECIES: helix-turn-helix transcriptional regulator [Nocardia]|uniref:helix-turn-helix transcriptional regulator n=1 Tax=Nocardia TaxID=1817 RepID=UPI000D6990B3|nr:MULTISPECIES: LuxR C-terminal-related transcriptional regulator [Nocardia]
MASEHVGSSPVGRVRQEWRRRENELIGRLSALRDAVFVASETAVAVPRVEWDGPWRSAEVVANLVHLCIDRLRDIKSADTATAGELCRLIVDLQQLAIDLYLFDTAKRNQRLADCAAGLSRMRGIPDTAGLLDVACEEIVLRCGFQRAVLSRVEGSAWMPWRAHFADDGAQSWFSDWIDENIPLVVGAPESQLLTKRRPSLVLDTTSARVYRPLIIDAGRSNSYVVAPVMHGDAVVGFIHADHNSAARRVDESDRDILWAFTDGFNHIYERTVLLEKLRTQRDQMRDLVVAAVDRMDDLCESGMSMARPADGEQRSVAPTTVSSSYGDIGDLTSREAEVFELMIDGATNRAIAERLVITEGTVKSHVKHILRKFGAANRSQAIAWSLGGK